MSNRWEPDPSLKGRQVVFVRPHSVVQNELLAELIRNEYAVAVLNDHTRVRDLFRTYPDCIAFLNIDEGYSEPEWTALVKEVGDGAFAQVRLGILSYNSDPELSRKYLLELMVPCGFIKLSLDLAESTKTVLRVLDANEAKGRRQFIRVLCAKGSASLNVVLEGRSVTGTVIDLSSVGMACRFEDDPDLVARTLVKGIQLRLKGVLCQVSAVVMGSRAGEEGRTVYIVLFDPKTQEETRERIRGFLRKTLQFQLEADLNDVSN